MSNVLQKEVSKEPTMRDGKPVNGWAAEAAMLIGEYGQQTKRGEVANQCNRVASRLLASVADTLEERDRYQAALRIVARCQNPEGQWAVEIANKALSHATKQAPSKGTPE